MDNTQITNKNHPHDAGYIRPANPDDADSAVLLIAEAIAEIAFALSQTNDIQKTHELLRWLFLSDISRIGYQHCIVYETNGVVCGLMAFYGGDKADESDKQVLKALQNRGINIDKLDKECFDDEFYVDSVAVNASYRKRGIATALFSYAEKEAKKQGYAKIALVVDEQKHKERAFYEKLGFSEDARFLIYGQTYIHMAKPLT